MNRHLFLSSILFLVLVLAGTGCRESSVVPYDDNSVNIKKLIERTWIFDSGSNGNDTSKSRNGWIIDIKSDGTYSTSSPNSSSTSGRWTYSASDSVIILRPNDGSNSTNLKIDSVSESLIDLRNTNDNEIIKMRSQVGPLFSISGNLLFEKNITIPRTRQVSVIWKSTGSDNRSFVWGHGKVDELNGSYKIDFNTYPPDSLIARFYGCKGKIGIGTIFLHSDPRLIIDGTSMEGSVPQNRGSTLSRVATPWDKLPMQMVRRINTLRFLFERVI